MPVVRFLTSQWLINFMMGLHIVARRLLDGRWSSSWMFCIIVKSSFILSSCCGRFCRLRNEQRAMALTALNYWDNLTATTSIFIVRSHLSCSMQGELWALLSCSILSSVCCDTLTLPGLRAHWQAMCWCIAETTSRLIAYAFQHKSEQNSAVLAFSK